MVATQVSGGARSTEDGHRLGENLVSRKRCLNWINTALQAHSPIWHIHWDLWKLKVEEIIQGKSRSDLFQHNFISIWFSYVKWAEAYSRQRVEI